VTGSATEWAWRQSRAKNSSLIVLLAIADEIDGKGKAEMSVAELARKARLSDRAVQLAARDLVTMGAITVEERAADAGRNRYHVPMVGHGRTGEESAPVKYLHPEESAPLPRIIHRSEPAAGEQKPQARPVKGEDISPPAPVDNFSDVLDLGSVVSGGKSRSRSSSEPPREDAERLCQHLADSIAANGSKRPSITKRWRDAARLLIDNDGRTEEQVMAAIDWSQKDEFWHRNILSMPTLRQQYDRLRLAWQAEQRKKSRPNGRQPTPDEFAALRDNWARPLDAMEAADDARGNDRANAVHRRGLPPAAD
jgi:hypothetical protein